MAGGKGGEARLQGKREWIDKAIPILVMCCFVVTFIFACYVESERLAGLSVGGICGAGVIFFGHWFNNRIYEHVKKQKY